MGAGKSSIGKRLADALTLRFVDADQELEARTGASVADIFACEGEAGFRRRESALLAELMQQRGLLLATGGGAVLAEANRKVLRDGGFVVYLQVSVAEQLRRLARDRSRPLLQRDDRAELLTQMASARDPLYQQVADLHFDTEAHSPERAYRELLSLLQQHWRATDA